MHALLLAFAALLMWPACSEAIFIHPPPHVPHKSFSDKSTLEQLIRDQTSTLNNLKSVCSSLQGGQKTIIGGVDWVKQSQNTLVDKSGALLNGQSKLGAALGDVLKNQAALQADVDGLTAGQAALKAGQQSLAKGQATLQAGQQSLANGISTLKAGQGDLKAGQADINKRIDGLENGQKSIQSSLSVLQAGQKNLQSSVDAVSNTVTEIRHVQKGLVVNVDKLLDDAAAKNKVLAQIQAAQQTIQANQAQIQSNQQTIRNDIHALKKFNDENTRAILEAEERNRNDILAALGTVTDNQKALKADTEAILGNQDRILSDLAEIKARLHEAPVDLIKKLIVTVNLLVEDVSKIQQCLVNVSPYCKVIFNH